LSRARSRSHGAMSALRLAAPPARWVSSSVGESAGTFGRRTYSAGEWLERTVDHAGPVEAGDHGYAARHRGRLESAHLLQPPQIQLDVRAGSCQRVEAGPPAPGEVAAEVGLGVDA
jgi:hypothetical protein